jgi:citrate synthase
MTVVSKGANLYQNQNFASLLHSVFALKNQELVMSEMNGHFVPGLQGVVAAETNLSSVDGLKGELIIAGFPVELLADAATHEEAIYLLWHDRLPNEGELAEFKVRIAVERPIAPATVELLQAAAAKKLPVMDALRMGAGTLDLTLDKTATNERVALTIVAQLPVIVAAYWRLLQGEEPLEPRTDLGQAANYLYMLTGKTADPALVRGLETYLNTVIDHGLNASTFAARVIVATQSDLVSAVVGAFGALKGQMHGGAPGPALDMVFEIRTAENAEPYLQAKLDRGDRLMGFGHRVYKVRDPRAEVLSKAAEVMFTGGGDMALYRLAREVEDTAVRLLEEYKPGRNLQTNVEYYTALLLHGLGLATDLFTPTFALSRAAGWLAHCFEQQREGRIIRPESRYRGEVNRAWLPIAERG